MDIFQVCNVAFFHLSVQKSTPTLKMIKRTILYALFLIISINAYAQDSLGVFKEIAYSADTTILTKPVKQKFKLKNYFQKGYPSPKKAVTLAVIPGLGQIYNKDYWKLPIVYLSLAGVIYAIDHNSSRYETFRRINDARTNPNSVFEDGFPTLPNAAIRDARDTFDKRRQLSWLGLFGFYIISAGEAFVDAHLKDFDVNDDISFQPSIQSSPIATTTIGVSVKIKLHK